MRALGVDSDSEPVARVHLGAMHTPVGNHRKPPSSCKGDLASNLASPLRASLTHSGDSLPAPRAGTFLVL